MIVLPDANLPNAVSGALWGAFCGAGQASSGIKRAYVMRQVADRFTHGVAAGARALHVGDPMDWRTEVGPTVSVEQLDALREVVDDAVAHGATLLCGGPVQLEAFPHGQFWAPAVLTGVTHDMGIMRQQVLGPVLPIMTVDSEEQAIGLANDSELGLGASVWTRDRPRGERIARRLEAGMVWLNDHAYSRAVPAAPWGGVKDSGLGRSGSKLGFHECVNPKLLSWEPSRTRNFWWHPYDESLARAVRASAQILHGREADKSRALRRGAVPLLRVGRRTLRDVLKR